MSDVIAESPYLRKQRECLYCHHGISDRRPVFLVGTKDGRILGPFHAGCASRLVEHARKNPTSNWLKGAVDFGEWPSIREETLPE